VTRRDDLDLVARAQRRVSARALGDEIAVARGRDANAVKAKLLDEGRQSRGCRCELLAVNENPAR
jgi:hypothetical protein